MTSYQVNFLVKAIIAVEVKAETLEQAITLAQDKIKGKVFGKGIDVLDEAHDVCGYDDNDMWREV